MTSCSSERANKAAALYDRPTDRARLVTCPISQTFSDDYLELYPVSIRRKRPFTGPPPEPPERSNTTIQGFSKSLALGCALLLPTLMTRSRLNSV